MKKNEAIRDLIRRTLQQRSYALLEGDGQRHHAQLERLQVVVRLTETSRRAPARVLRALMGIIVQSTFLLLVILTILFVLKGLSIISIVCFLPFPRERRLCFVLLVFRHLVLREAFHLVLGQAIFRPHRPRRLACPLLLSISKRLMGIFFFIFIGGRR